MRKTERKENLFPLFFSRGIHFSCPLFSFSLLTARAYYGLLFCPKQGGGGGGETASVFFPLSSRLGSVVLFSSLRGKYRNVRENSNLVVQLSAKAAEELEKKRGHLRRKKEEKSQAHFRRFRNFFNPPKRGMVAHTNFMLNWTPISARRRRSPL